MPTFIPDPSSTIRDSCQAYITLHYIHVSHHNVHTQTNTNHPRMNKHPNNVLPRPTPRSGWRVSLRRDVLAQASPLSPRWGLKEASREHHGISLRRDPSRLGEVFVRSKIWAGRLGDLSRNRVWVSPCSSRLGETGSLGRD